MNTTSRGQGYVLEKSKMREVKLHIIYECDKAFLAKCISKTILFKKIIIRAFGERYDLIILNREILYDLITSNREIS